MSTVNINYTNVSQTQTKSKNLCLKMSSDSLQDIRVLRNSKMTFRSWNTLRASRSGRLLGKKPTFVDIRKRECTDELNYFKLLESLVFFTNQTFIVCVSRSLVKSLILHCKTPSWNKIRGSESKICHSTVWLLYNQKQQVAYTDRSNSRWHMNNKP